MTIANTQFAQDEVGFNLKNLPVPAAVAAFVTGFALVAGLMVDALDQAADSGSREAALVHFVERVGVDEVDALRRALADLEEKNRDDPPAGGPGIA